MMYRSGAEMVAVAGCLEGKADATPFNQTLEDEIKQQPSTTDLNLQDANSTVE